MSRNEILATRAAATRCLATCHTAMPERQGAVTPTNTKRSAVGRSLDKAVWVHSMHSITFCCDKTTNLKNWSGMSHVLYVECDQFTKDQIRIVLLWTECSGSFRFASRCCRTSKSFEVPVLLQDPEAAPLSKTSYVAYLFHFVTFVPTESTRMLILDPSMKDRPNHV